MNGKFGHMEDKGKLNTPNEESLNNNVGNSENSENTIKSESKSEDKKPATGPEKKADESAGKDTAASSDEKKTVEEGPSVPTAGDNSDEDVDKSASKEDSGKEMVESSAGDEKAESAEESLQPEEEEKVKSEKEATEPKAVPAENKGETSAAGDVSESEPTTDEPEKPEVAAGEKAAEKKEKPESEKRELTEEEKKAKASAELAEKDEHLKQNYTLPTEVSNYDKGKLLDTLKRLVGEAPVHEIGAQVDALKSYFYKKHKAELAVKKKNYLESGGTLEFWDPGTDQTEEEFNTYLALYKDKKTDYLKKQEEEKETNLQLKYKIIEELKDLVNRKESINKTFNEFRELQNRWRNVGLVPQAKLKDLWETYHHHVENFYDYIKINKELRDLDLKKNYEAKIKLCEKAEDLLMEPSIVKAHSILQDYHAEWREIGPVPRESKEDLWARFKEATSKINKKHQEYFEHLKKEQRNNLEAKVALCEKAEEIANAEITGGFKEWEAKSNEMVEMQNVWKTIGFATKKENNRVYKRFRSACDQFFSRKREFYKENKDRQKDNLQKKIDLCVQAESMKDSTEWKKTTDEFIKIQKEWKKIGPVPKKYSDSIWQRFRSACDYFFENKYKQHANVDAGQEENLEKKRELIEKVKAMKASSDEDFKALQEIQKEFSEIGFVPLKYKNSIREDFRKAINEKFDQLDIDDSQRSLERFKGRMESILANDPRGKDKLVNEKNKYFNKLKQFENNIQVWENNIGFFNKSKNSESMISKVNDKIESAREKVDDLNQRIRFIEDLLSE